MIQIEEICTIPELTERNIRKSSGGKKEVNLNSKDNGVGESKVDKVVNNHPEPAKPIELSEPSEVKKIEETLELKRGPRWEKILIVAIYAVVLLAIVYFILASFFPQVFNANTYVIDAKDSQMFNSLNSFYIDKPVLGDKLNINDEVVRPIVSAQPFNLVFVPKVNIPSQNATLILNLYLNGTGSNIYLDDKLITFN